jgi:ferric-dicitrate binding protein FerR (iron transport regulator)
LSERPPVDQLSDVAWARVERGVFSRIESTVTHAAASRDVGNERTHGWVWVAVPLAAAAAAALAFFSQHDQPAPTASTEQEPARVVAGSSPSAVTFADAHITLEAQSAITMDQKGGKPTATLEYGGAWFEVAPRGDRAPFVVLAGDLSVKVVGTRFRVARTAEHAAVDVDHGVVEVHYRGKLTTLHGHEQWTSDDLSALDQPTRTTPTEADYQAVVQQEASSPATALRAYLELARAQGQWAEVALYAAARLAADQHDARAEALATVYLRRYPSGANATDARQLLTRLKGE